MPAIPAFQRLRQEDCKIETNLGYIQSLFQENKSSSEFEKFLLLYYSISPLEAKDHTYVCVYMCHFHVHINVSTYMTKSSNAFFSDKFIVERTYKLTVLN